MRKKTMDLVHSARQALPAVLLSIFLLFIPQTASAEIDCVQEELISLGYRPGPADGVMGRRTRDAAQAFADQAELDLPDLTNDTAVRWCAELRTFAVSPMGAIMRSSAAQLLPLDVLMDFHNMNAERRGELCLPRASLSGLMQLEPVRQIEGFTSRMRSASGPDSDWVPGARDIETFSADLGNLAMRALATDDDRLKGQLLDELSRWADAGALLDTFSCAVSRRQCTQWTVSDGSDLSPVKDWEFTVNNGSAIVRTYYIALADFEPEERQEQHARIVDWILALGELYRPADDVPQVYFFGEVFWPIIVDDYAAGRTEAARASLERLERALDSVVFAADGSILQATNRGDRALWYHYYGLSLIVPTMEMMRAANIPISARAEDRLHEAVALFLATLDDPDVIRPWASQQRNSTYNGTQDFDFNGWNTFMGGGSWTHIYPYRYPEREEAQQLRARVPLNAPTASRDNFFGPGLGCIYNAAAEYRYGENE